MDEIETLLDSLPEVLAKGDVICLLATISTAYATDKQAAINFLSSALATVNNQYEAAPNCTKLQ